MRPVVHPYTVQTCDGGRHRRRDRPNGGLYVCEGFASMTISTMKPVETVVVATFGMGERNAGSIRFMRRRPR